VRLAATLNKMMLDLGRQSRAARAFRAEAGRRGAALAGGMSCCIIS
jgi:hypothetical protein